jgi:hypothetical protein
VERFGDQLLAGSAFALDQDGGAGGSHLRHQVEDAQHRLALADDIFKVVALLQRPLELDILFFRALPGNRGADIGQKLFVVPGLLDEVLRPAIHGVDHIADGSIGGDHDHRQVGLALPDAGQNLQAILARQRQVQQNQVVGSGIDVPEPGLTLGGRLHDIAFEQQQRLQRFANGCFVVDDQNAVSRFGRNVRFALRNENAGLRHARASLPWEIPDGRWFRCQPGFPPGSCRHVPG